jgi:hypothetical protein
VERWKTTVKPCPHAVRLLMTDPDRNEVVKAALPPSPEHPRALLTLLEGLALWTGHPLTAAISVGPAEEMRCAGALFGEGLVPIDSALVRFDIVEPARRRRTLPGVGDFRQLRLLHGRWA